MTEFETSALMMTRILDFYSANPLPHSNSLAQLKHDLVHILPSLFPHV